MSEQGSEEWKQQRLGKVTASRMGDLTARTRSGYGASRANLMAELVVERLTGVPNDGYLNDAMRWGLEHEAAAVTAYEFYQDVTTEKVGFISHPEITESGASPDRLVGTDGLVEVKCPNTATHLEMLLTQTVPQRYLLQMQWQLACSQRRWCDFVSYDPRLPEHLRFWVRRIERDEQLLIALTAEVQKFLAELNQKLTQLNQLSRNHT